MENEHENCASKYVCYVLDLFTDVENRRCIDSIFSKVVNGPTVKKNDHNESASTRNYLESLGVLNVSERKEK